MRSRIVALVLCALPAGCSGSLEPDFGLGVESSALDTTITVNTTNMGTVNDGNCGLLEAIASVHAGSGLHGCTGPGSNTKIVLQHTGTATYSTTGSIVVYKSVAIVGQGIDKTFIEAATGVRLEVNAAGNASIGLERLTVRKHASQDTQSSAISVQGNDATNVLTVTLNGLKVSGFVSHGIQAYSVTPALLEAPYTVTLNINDSLISSNGGVGLQAIGDTKVLLTRTTVSQNLLGGLAFLDGSEGRLDFCTVEGNSTPGDGGGIATISSPFTDPEGAAHLDIDRSLIFNNTAAGNGGGIYYDAEHGYSLFRSTVSGNRAAQGGGLYSRQRDYANADYSTIAFNNATKGGGVYDKGWGSGPTNLRRSIVAKNTLGGNPASSSNGTDVFCENGAGACMSYSLLGTRQGGNLETCLPMLMPTTFAGTLDPQIDALAYLGGPTRVHRLQPTSPAIDFAEPLTNDPPNYYDVMDQRGFTRPVDGNFSVSSTDWDSGAYEYGAYQLLEAATSLRPSSMVYTEAGTGAKYVEVFVTASDTNIRGQRASLSSSGALGPWSSPAYVTDGGTTRAPSVVPIANNQVYFFVTGSQLWGQKRLANYTFGAWENLGNHTSIASGPAAVNVNNDVWVFVRGTDNQLKHRIYASSSGTWGSWQTSLGTTTVSNDPAAVYLGGTTNKIYVFARKGGVIAWRSCTPSSCTWSAWTNVDSTAMTSSPTVAARGTNKIELCSKNNFQGLSCNTRTGSTWSGWTQRPSSSALNTAPGISSRGDGNTVDLFMVRAADNQIDYQQMPQ